jgi:hypothetical protein
MTEKQDKELAEFTVRICATSDKKQLKNRSKTYKYGTISIRDPTLTQHVGETVLVKVFAIEKVESEK